LSPHYGKFIAYFRVSTDRQGKSGLGLEAQREKVMNYLNGGRWTLVGEFTEVESGKRADRPELEKALAACKSRRPSSSWSRRLCELGHARAKNLVRARSQCPGRLMRHSSPQVIRPGLTTALHYGGHCGDLRHYASALHPSLWRDGCGAMPRRSRPASYDELRSPDAPPRHPP
jgi:hypothetical protein